MHTAVQVIRAIVRDELRTLRLGEIGVVTSVFPVNGPASADTYSCSIKLRERNVELRKVPIATPHIGLVSCPAVGDLVVVVFVGGDADAPVVIGRLHSESVRPPKHADGELVIEAPASDETRVSLEPDGTMRLRAGDSTVVLAPDGTITIKGKDLAVEAEGKVALKGKATLAVEIDKDATIAVKGNATIRAKDCKLEASGKILLGEGGGGVITEKSHKCYYTGQPLIGSKSVKAKG